MFTKFARILLTASSFAPVGLTYAWVAFRQGQTTIAIWSVIFGLLAVSLCLVLLRFARNSLESLDFKAATVEPSDSESFGFMLLYLLPLFTDKIDTLNWEVWIPVILVYFAVVATGHGYHFNPMLGIMQWHFYKVSSFDGISYVLVTKKHIRSAGAPLKVCQLTEYMLLDLE